jgi:hypothetical protein
MGQVQLRMERIPAWPDRPRKPQHQLAQTNLNNYYKDVQLHYNVPGNLFAIPHCKIFHFIKQPKLGISNLGNAWRSKLRNRMPSACKQLSAAFAPLAKHQDKPEQILICNDNFIMLFF